MVEGSADDLAKKIVDLEAEWDQWKVEKVKLEEEVMKVKSEEERMRNKYMKMKGKYLEISKKFDSKEMKWKEEKEKIVEKYWEAEVKKRELTIDLEAALSQQRGGDEGATEAEAKVKKMEEENSKLTQKIQALEGDKEQMVAEVLQLQKEKSEEVAKSFSLKKALEAEKKRLVEVEGENIELAKKIEALHRQKDSLERDFKDKIVMETKKMKMEEEKNSKLIMKIQALERYKEEMVAEVSNLQKRKSEEASVKKALEAEKKRSKEIQGKNSELAKKIVEYERERKTMHCEVSKLNRKKCEEVKKILEEKLDVEDENKAYEASENIKKIVVALMKKSVTSQIQGDIKIGVQTPVSSAERIQPSSGKLTGGRCSWVRALTPP